MCFCICVLLNEGVLVSLAGLQRNIVIGESPWKLTTGRQGAPAMLASAVNPGSPHEAQRPFLELVLQGQPVPFSFCVEHRRNN